MTDPADSAEHRTGAGERDHIRHTRALVEVLRVTQAETERLSEMISHLKRAPHMDDARLGVLMMEWKVACDRARSKPNCGNCAAITNPRRCRVVPRRAADSAQRRSDRS